MVNPFACQYPVICCHNVLTSLLERGILHFLSVIYDSKMTDKKHRKPAPALKKCRYDM
jgi:hypothetical protein